MKLSIIYLTGLCGWLVLFNGPAGLLPEPVRAVNVLGRPELNAVADSLDAATGLVLAPGLQLVKENCIRCHSPKLITAKRANREGWLTTIRWMQQTQGLGDLGPAEPVILDYLTQHYALRQSGRRPALPVTKWYQLKSKPGN